MIATVEMEESVFLDSVILMAAELELTAEVDVVIPPLTNAFKLDHFGEKVSAT